MSEQPAGPKDKSKPAPSDGEKNKRQRNRETEGDLGWLRGVARAISRVRYGKRFEKIPYPYHLYIDPIQRWASEAAYRRLLKQQPILTLKEYRKQHKRSKIEEFVPCLVCGSRKLQPLFHPQHRLRNRTWEYHVVRCPNCGLLYRNPSVKPAKLHLLYKGNYSKFLEGHYAEERKRKYRLSMDAYAPYLDNGQGKRILDYGCGTGIFLKMAQARGFDPWGIDLSKDSIRVARKKRNLEHVYHGTIEDVPEIAAGGFDVITLWSVLAHLPRPVETFAQLRGLLKPTGVLALLTINANSLTLKHYRNTWNGFTKNHLAMFSRKPLEKLAKQAGFSSVEFRPYYGDMLESGKLKLPPKMIAQLRKIEDETHSGKMMRALLFNGERPG